MMFHSLMALMVAAFLLAGCALGSEQACKSDLPAFCAEFSSGIEQLPSDSEQLKLTLLGDWYASENCGSSNFVTAMELYRQAAAQDSGQAMLRIAGLYEAGLGVAADLDEAAYWYRRYVLNTYYVIELGFDTDFLTCHSKNGLFPWLNPESRLFQEAVAWIKSVKQGSPQLQYETALKLRDGDGAPRAPKVAGWLLRDAGRKGHAQANYELAVGLLEGTFQGKTSRAEDKERARFYMKEAAIANYGPAVFAYADMLMEESPTTLQMLDVYTLLLRASRNGVVVPEARLEEARGQLPEFYQRRAERDANKLMWLPP